MIKTADLNKTTRTTLSPSLGELKRRMKGPQRYRLLQGYPMPTMMKKLENRGSFEPVPADTSRKLIVGVLPHASCAPSMKGCGYCTFPHESFHRDSVRKTVESVLRELDLTNQRGREVEALYFGGGTANLTPAPEFRRLLKKVDETFQLRNAEITLEGAPAFFLTRNSELLELLATEITTQSKRVSMGVQTFDVSMLEKMGRLALGHPTQVAKAVNACHERGMTCSADLMINLPGQTVAQMIDDVEHAASIGFDQICLYHLVLFRGLGTPWSKNRDMLRSLPDNNQAFLNWLQVKNRLVALGYVQKTVTNFEKRGNYRYENDSYQPESFDALGFGPAGISCFTDLKTQTAAKWINETDNSAYRNALKESDSARERLFVYGQTDLKLLFLTRALAGLTANRLAYNSAYGGDPLEDFSEEFDALTNLGLTEITDDRVKLTEKGNFFADSVTGLLARRRVSEIRNSLDDPNSSKHVHMG